MLRSARFLGLSVLFAGLSLATTITYPPTPTTYISNPCSAYAGYTCSTSAYFSDSDFQSVDDINISPLFVNAFDAWKSLAGNGDWQLLNGGELGGTFTVTPAAAGQFDAANLPAGNVIKGGLTINVAISSVTFPTLVAGDVVVWAQGLYDNYLTTGGTVDPFYEMDITTACAGPVGSPTENVFCGPAYPYQYNDDHFYDQPKVTYYAPGSTQGFFDANTYLSIINYSAETLTVYDGFAYGFRNSVSPEPSTWLLLGTGVFFIAFAYRRRAMK